MTIEDIDAKNSKLRAHVAGTSYTALRLRL